MKVREIMDSRIRQISSSAMLSEAADRMRALDAEILPVVENRAVIGIISSEDITRCTGRDPETTPIRDAMTRGATCCSQDDDVEEAARLMETNHARRLIVLDPRGEAVGILSAEDLASRADEHAHVIADGRRRP